MAWELSHRFDRKSRVIADRHYSRQTPGSRQFVAPGRCCVLYTSRRDGQALWVTSWPYKRYTKHEWAGAWVNTLFRNEGAGLSSALIVEAIACTRWVHLHTASWRGPIPEMGLITFVDSKKVQGTNPGYCYECAGFTKAGKTKGGLIAWQLRPNEMPKPRAPINSQLELLPSTRHAA